MSSTDSLSLHEKRQLLEHVRIKFGFETTIPREMGIDRIVEKSMVGSSPDSTLLVVDIVDRLASRQLPLRHFEVGKSLDRLIEAGKVQCLPSGGKRYYCLTPTSSQDIDREVAEADARLTRIVARLYSDINVEHAKLRRFVLKFLAEIFARLSHQWVEQAFRRPRVDDVVAYDQIRALLDAAAEYVGLARKNRSIVYERTLSFFKHDDADYDLLKYILGQSYFIVRLLALDKPYDHLSAELFSGSTLCLDTNVVISALLPGASRFNAFQEVVEICKRLGIRLVVLYPTYRETQTVVEYEKSEIAPLYEEIPPELVSKTRGQFYRTYVAFKETDPSFTSDDVFKPFNDLRKTLMEAYSIEVVDDTLFDELAKSPQLPKIKRRLAEKSIQIRNRGKGDAALEHDALVCLYVDRSGDGTTANRILTLDRSLPSATTDLFPGDASMAISLDGFLQSISPFVSADREADFAAVFARLIEAQVLPQDQIYDIRDYLIFHDMGLSCQKMAPEQVNDALQLLKRKVLRGDHYTRDNFEKASYEFKKLFTQRFLKNEELLAAKEKEMEELRKQHERELHAHQGRTSQEIKEVERKFRLEQEKQANEADRLRSSLTQLEGQIEADKLKRLRIVRAAKWIGIAVWLVGGIVVVTWLALRFGEGSNAFQRIRGSWSLYLAVLVLGEALIGLLIPEHGHLGKIIKAITSRLS